jgi:hypothetical protein
LDFGSILYNYVTEGWFFCVIHIILLILTWRTVNEIRHETKELIEWVPGKSGQCQCTTVLAQFVDECSHWGAHGILTPLTDFTDRLDSRVEGMMEGLSGRINLFLIVGVAGTFAGLFDFANGMVAQLTGNADSADPRIVVSALTSGLAKALPVSIVGIALTIAGHIYASHLEGRFRSALTNATQQAMQYRRQQNQSLADLLREAVLPFRDVSQVMATTIRPVLEQVERSATSISTCLAPFSQSVERFSGAIEHMSQAVNQIDQTLSASQAHMAELKETRDRLTTKTANLVERMERIESVMSRASEDLGKGAEHISDLADGLAGAVKDSMGEMQSEIVTQWQYACAEYLKALAPVVQMLQATNEDLRQSGRALNTGFASGLADVTQQMQSSWGQLVNQMMGVHDQRFAALNTSLVEVNNKLVEAAQTFHSAALHSDTVQREGAAGVVRELLRDYDSSLQEIRQFLQEDLPPGLVSLREGVGEMQQLRRDTATTALQFHQATQNALQVSERNSDATERLNGQLTAVANALPELTPALCRAVEYLERSTPGDNPGAGEHGWRFWKQRFWRHK